ncbi:hypothetical protein DL98DRAFT_607012 [Cadophora sp. DSE1049]|nr:hypothetical protein DL98DRAFT_607012 [Cadophora sp. DSE1049]
MKRYIGRAKETTIVLLKPILTGYKIWVIAEHGYFLRWVFHSKGTGPVGVITSFVLGGKKNGSGAVVVYLLDLLLSQRYIVYLDNFFTSNALLEYLRELEYGAIGTARIDAGIVKRIYELKLN